MILKTQSLSPTFLAIIRDRGTEPPFIGKHEASAGTALCRQCGLALFRSEHKFNSGCGWPSFDEPITNTVQEQADPDGLRTEIVCAHCLAHLGHVFRGEGFTHANTRYCVNTLSLDFITDKTVSNTEELIMAAGCFWGVEHYFQQLKGVVKTEVGYTGGHVAKPSYEMICAGNTGHVEAIRVLYDSKILDAAAVLRYFFEIHDPTQTDGQGPDLGEQYHSVVFYYNEEQHLTALSLIEQLTIRGYQVATQLLPVRVFWPAEDYHQLYYAKTGKLPYCHRYVARF